MSQRFDRPYSNTMNTPTVCPLYTAGMCPKMNQAPVSGVSPVNQGNPNMQPVNYMPMNTQPMNVQPMPCNNYVPMYNNPVNPYMVNPNAGMNYNPMMNNPGAAPMQAPAYRFDTEEEIQGSSELETEYFDYNDRGSDFNNPYTNDMYMPSVNMKTVDASEIED